VQNLIDANVKHASYMCLAQLMTGAVALSQPVSNIITSHWP